MCGINDEMFRRFKPPRARRESTSSWKELLNNLLIAGCTGCSPRSAMTTWGCAGRCGQAEDKAGYAGGAGKEQLADQMNTDELGLRVNLSGDRMHKFYAELLQVR